MAGYDNVIHNVTFGRAVMRHEEDEERSLMGQGRTSAWADRRVMGDQSDQAGSGGHGSTAFPSRADFGPTPSRADFGHGDGHAGRDKGDWQMEREGP
ncbi:unnamed protein product [Linum trigynum]|uniref:Uncharacterized protein n=1 Tax=Linum trigynum TaxID=586398 RepID=A0AAV2FV19_9ROSI